jgi:dTDP-4-dehydrorhamnose 3,5-epimerase
MKHVSQSQVQQPVIEAVPAVTGYQRLTLPCHVDGRGFFATLWEQPWAATLGHPFQTDNVYVSANLKAGTLRGMHFQSPPHAQAKLVFCLRGALYDVALDLRPASPTHLRWQATELSEEKRLGVFIPAGCAHGFVTLRDDTQLLYLIQGPYVPASAGAVRWDDPCFGIQWPTTAPMLSDRDRHLPDYRP